MKKIYLSLLTLATLAFAACSDSESIADAPNVTNGNTAENAITFSTYMGQAKDTRAGYEGSITTSVLEGLNDGFGVFAYYTGKDTYDLYQRGTYTKNTQGVSTTNHEPNFMYNQRVYYNSSAPTGSVTKWTYAPVKYWPNEVKNDAVDDQDENTSNNPAYTSYNYGGNVSFFAYAPYTYVTPNSGTPKNTDDNSTTWTNYNGGTTDGIVAITSNATTGDPLITYVIAGDGNTVDLLWGTYHNTSENVVSETANNNGVAGDGDKNNDNESTRSYQESILGTYKLNADLTKQKTTGTIGFNFKHALAKVGGSTTVTTLSGEAKNGLMVILDIDDAQGAEDGGSLAEGVTKVTINSVEITNDFNGDGDTGDTQNSIEEMGTNKGVFNLATGQWTNMTSVNNGTMSHTIYPTNSATTGNATLNPAIAEPLVSGGNSGVYDEQGKNRENADGTKNYENFFSAGTGFSGVTGVLSSKKLPVYSSNPETNPLVFIPGTTPALKITVDYTVRTKDANLMRGYSEVRQVISKLIKFSSAVELNKQYSLLMHLGLTSVKFTATVSDWDVAYTDANGNNSPDPDEYDIEDVYLPRNVSELQSVVLQNASGAALPTNISSTENTVTIGKVALNYSDDSDDKVVAYADWSSENISISGVEVKNAESSATAISLSGNEITFPRNDSEYDRTYTITVTRGTGTSGTDNNQTATYTFTQAAAAVSSIALTLTPYTGLSTSASNHITASVTATYDNGWTKIVSEGGRYTLTYNVTTNSGGTSTNSVSGNTITSSGGTASEVVTVQATYNDKDNSATATYE